MEKDSGQLNGAGSGDAVSALLLSNVNMQPLIAFLRPWEVTCGEFNSILLDLANPASPATSPQFSHVLCVYDSDTMMGDAWYGEGAPNQCDAFLEILQVFCSAHPEKVVVANTFCFRSSRWLNYADLLHPESLREQEIRLNAQLLSIARRNPNLLVTNLELLFRRYGEDVLLSNAFWYLGRIRYTNLMFRSLAVELHRAVQAYAHRSRKVLVLDLDNTLWGGVLGEAGPLGVRLSEDGEGRCYRDFQRALKAVQRTGVLLAVCSKNNPADVDEIFENNSMMILRRDDFACIRANWDPKPKNLMDIAESLNLAVDSFVFIDDSSVERELIMRTLPEIAVPVFPTPIENLPDWFLREVVPVWFGKYAITEEDHGKTAQYRANEERRQLSRSLDLDTFLRDLNIDLSFQIDPAEQITRIAQMTQKTNQFNLTTRRYHVQDIRRFLDSSDHAVILMEYKDRFAAEGAVGLVILDFSTACIDSFLMSCRVIGRGVEIQMLEKACELFRARGLPKINAEFLPTRRNQQVSGFYESCGFTLLSEDGEGRKRYERQLS